ncbi:MAG TPA: FmdB family zinc ribbon protein [Pyrinomonadaceae bacterium]|jgi:putative FmdB family regulatory protein|nr:FmdB family zinc ribbon protein [Pyrinomonadaceae bacterium]
MPIYEYTCQKCAARVEILQKLSDKPLTKCKECGGRLEKQWSQTGVQFKGSGWYVTDYARKGEDKKSDGAGESKSDAKAETKSEAQAESRSETAKGDEKKTPKATPSSKGATKD